jgi:hypothetical protein
MPHPLEKRIADREEAIRQLDAEAAQIAAKRARIEAEVAAYRDALQFVLPKPERAPRATSSSGRRGGVGDNWKQIISNVSGEGTREFTTDDVMAYSDIMDLGLQRATARAQCANFVKAGYLSRVKDGHFTVTFDGRAAFLQMETAGGSSGGPTPAALATTTHNGG